MKKTRKKNAGSVIAFGSAAEKMLGTDQPHPDHSCGSALAILKRKRVQALQVLGNIDTAIRAIKALR